MVALAVRPARAPLSRPRTEKGATEGGLDVASQHNVLAPVVAKLGGAGVSCSWRRSPDRNGRPPARSGDRDHVGAGASARRRRPRSGGWSGRIAGYRRQISASKSTPAMASVRARSHRNVAEIAELNIGPPGQEAFVELGSRAQMGRPWTVGAKAGANDPRHRSDLVVSPHPGDRAPRRAPSDASSLRPACRRASVPGSRPTPDPPPRTAPTLGTGSAPYSGATWVWSIWPRTVCSLPKRCAGPAPRDHAQQLRRADRHDPDAGPIAQALVVISAVPRPVDAIAKPSKSGARGAITQEGKDRSPSHQRWLSGLPNIMRFKS